MLQTVIDITEPVKIGGSEFKILEIGKNWLKIKIKPIFAAYLVGCGIRIKIKGLNFTFGQIEYNQKNEAILNLDENDLLVRH